MFVDLAYVQSGAYHRHQTYKAPGKLLDFRHIPFAQVKNPATGEVIATVPCMKANETSAAVAEATSAWPEWSTKVAKERSKIMRKYAPCTDVCKVLLAAEACNKVALYSTHCQLSTKTRLTGVSS